MLNKTGAPGPEGSIQKLYWSELNQRMAQIAMEVLGPYAQLTDYDGGRWVYNYLPLARQHDRGRHQRSPAEHHRPARARLAAQLLSRQSHSTITHKSITHNDVIRDRTMEFDLSKPQRLLQKSARDLFARECPPKRVRELMATDTAFNPELWSAVADQGWLGIHLAEAPADWAGHGGTGRGRRGDGPGLLPRSVSGHRLGGHAALPATNPKSARSGEAHHRRTQGRRRAARARHRLEPGRRATRGHCERWRLHALGQESRSCSMPTRRTCSSSPLVRRRASCWQRAGEVPPA